MLIFLQLTAAGVDTGPNFELYSDADGYATPFDTATRLQLLDGDTFIAPPETTTVKIQSLSPPSDCDSFVLVVLGASTTSTTSSTSTSSSTSSTTTTTTTIICEEWRNDTESEVTVNYTTCEGTPVTNYAVATTFTICARPGSISYPLGGGPLTNIGTCGTTSSTTTTTTTAAILSYTLYECGTTTPTGSRIPYTGTLSGGDIILGSDNVCYTVAGTSTSAPNIGYTSSHASCIDCNAAITP